MDEHDIAMIASSNGMTIPVMVVSLFFMFCSKFRRWFVVDISLLEESYNANSFCNITSDRTKNLLRLICGSNEVYMVLVLTREVQRGGGRGETSINPKWIK